MIHSLPGQITLSLETSMSPDVAEAIGQTVLGQPGGIRYKLADAVSKARTIKPLHFLTIRRRQTLLAVMAVAERVTQCLKADYPTYYVRYVTFHTGYYVKQLPHAPAKEPLRSQGNSLLKKLMQEYASQLPWTLPQPTDTTKRLFYAYVEESNWRSMQFTQFFFEQIRTVKVTTFSRLFPKTAKGFQPLQPGDLDPMMQLLKEHYCNHSFFFISHGDLAGNYYVLKDGDKIVAGVKAGVGSWKLEQIPGFAGTFIQRILPRLPILSRLFTHRLFRFLTFDTLFLKSGYEHLLPVLLESVCAHRKIYAGMLYTDATDPLYTPISQCKNMGFLNKMHQGANVALLVRFVNFDSGEKRNLSRQPAYISGFDLC